MGPKRVLSRFTRSTWARYDVVLQNLAPGTLSPCGSELRMILQSASISRISDTLVFAPTFNERRTIGPLLDGLLSLPERFDVLIVDDHSCDGTADYLTARAATRLIMRSGKFGVGSAHKIAWLQARQHGYSRLATLDADLSHDPKDVSRVLALLDEGADVAFGSRFLPGSRLDYSGWRLFVSRNANRVARLLLHLISLNTRIHCEQYACNALPRDLSKASQTMDMPFSSTARLSSLATA